MQSTNPTSPWPPLRRPPSQRASARKETETMVERLMGKKPELRFQFIQENAQFVKEVDV